MDAIRNKKDEAEEELGDEKSDAIKNKPKKQKISGDGDSKVCKYCGK